MQGVSTKHGIDETAPLGIKLGEYVQVQRTTVLRNLRAGKGGHSVQLHAPMAHGEMQSG